MKKGSNRSAYAFLAIAVFMPVLVYADFLGASTFKGVIESIVEVIKLLTPILFGLAFILFFWGMSKFILNSGSPAEIQNGKNYMMWGILALFILLTFHAIIGLVYRELEFGTRDPSVPGVFLPQKQ